MKIFFLYLLTGITTLWTVLYQLGFSAGFANYVPIAAIIGSALLFSVASPTILLNRRLGSIIGIIGMLMMLPFDIGFTISLFSYSTIDFGLVIAFIPIISITLSLFHTIKNFKAANIQIDYITKILLISIPIFFTILYIVTYGKYWALGMFKIR